MKYTSQENKLIEKIKAAIPDVTPGVTARAYYMGRLVCDISVGQTYPYYDLASMTKIIFTQQAMMEAFDQGRWQLNTKVKDVLPDFKHDDILITELLTHTSGLEWWLPFYQSIDLDKNWEKKRPWIFQQINNSKINKTGKSVYSDLGFILLGFILEKLSDKNLHEVWLGIKERYYPTTTLGFHLENKTDLPLNQFAPTEDCTWRKKILRGQVHDENTYSFGGIATHSGLFGSIEDVSAFGLNVRSQLQGIARYSVRQKTAQLFAQRAVPSEIGDWALGYMMPSIENPSCGPHFSVLSIGHTGFTGTSFWYDPRNDLLVLILSNRVHYGRDNKGFIALRPKIHTWIFETLKRTV
ncbi:MAG: serine hydrolase [Bdellovibrionaceae bacterium]|nr:serine hydrolase [Bdellovibrio sp.]